MLSYDDAKSIAKEYLKKSTPTPPEGYYFDFEDGVEIDVGWIFVYLFLCKLDIPEEEQERVGGAYAFIITKADGQGRSLTYQMYEDLINSTE